MAKKINVFQVYLGKGKDLTRLGLPYVPVFWDMPRFLVAPRVVQNFQVSQALNFLFVFDLLQLDTN